MSKDGQPSWKGGQGFEIMKCVHDFQGWVERAYNGGGKPIMTGLFRIDVAAIEGLLAASGRDGWFVEPLKWLEEYHVGNRHQSSGM